MVTAGGWRGVGRRGAHCGCQATSLSIPATFCYTDPPLPYTCSPPPPPTFKLLLVGQKREIWGRCEGGKWLPSILKPPTLDQKWKVIPDYCVQENSPPPSSLPQHNTECVDHGRFGEVAVQLQAICPLVMDCDYEPHDPRGERSGGRRRRNKNGTCTAGPRGFLVPACSTLPYFISRKHTALSSHLLTLKSQIPYKTCTGTN